MTTILCGDVREKLREIKPGVVQTCVTSPPYWGLRDYGMDQQLGSEKTPEEYVANMVEVFREVKRTLRDDGTLWLNLGDSYANTPVGKFNGGGDILSGRDLTGHSDGSKFNKLKASGLKQKDLVGIPWRVAFALQADGWYLRQDIIWHKPNPMPESVRDRCTKAHEYLFLLTKSSRYYFDAEAIKEESASPASMRRRPNGVGAEDQGRRTKDGCTHDCGTAETRNRRSVWTITPKPYKGAHFAVFPPDLVEPCILAGTSERGRCQCGKPLARIVDRKRIATRTGENSTKSPDPERHVTTTTTTGWDSPCCGGEPVPCLVLDPFLGSGTTLMVAKRTHRDGIGVELNPEYVKLAQERIGS